MRRVLLVGALVGVTAVSPLASGCSQDCTARGCGDEGLTVALEARCWPDGTYEVSGTADGEPFSIPVQLPVPPSAELHDGAVWVGANDLVGIQVVQVRDTGLEEVELRIRREGVLVVEETLAPAYERSYPNGQECEPVCTHAEETIVVPQPAADALCDLLEEP